MHLLHLRTEKQRGSGFISSRALSATGRHKCTLFVEQLIDDVAVVKNPPASAGDAGSIPGLGRSLGEGNGNPLQFSCLGNLVDGGAWWATVHGVTKESDMTQ